MRKIIPLFLLATLSGGTFAAYNFNEKKEVKATCTGAKTCRACKNCKYCKHCAKDGGTCGVCKK